MSIRYCGPKAQFTNAITPHYYILRFIPILNLISAINFKMLPGTAIIVRCLRNNIIH